MIVRRSFLLAVLLLFFLNTIFPQEMLRFKKEVGSGFQKGTTPVQRQTGVMREQAFILDKPIDPEVYVVGPGDEFYISIFTDELVEFKERVNPAGDLVIPGVGKVSVAGRRLSDAIGFISDFVRKNGVRTGLVSVSLSDVRSFKVQILGAVFSPGFYVVDSVTRLSELVSMAGGFLQLARLHQIYLYRGGTIVDTVDFVNYLLYGDMDNNPYLAEGEMVYVSFGDVVKEGVQLRGAVVDSGYCIIKDGESLWSLLKRKGALKKNAGLDYVIVIRNEGGEKKLYKVAAGEFDKWVLKAGDEINVITIKGVSVVGYVNKPGEYDYLPGLSAWDYIGLAGGVTEKGSLKKIVVVRENGEKEKGRNVVIRRGDVIIVGRSVRDVLVGERASILEITASLMSVFLAYMAATRYRR